MYSISICIQKVHYNANVFCLYVNVCDDVTSCVYIVKECVYLNSAVVLCMYMYFDMYMFYIQYISILAIHNKLMFTICVVMISF